MLQAIKYLWSGLVTIGLIRTIMGIRVVFSNWIAAFDFSWLLIVTFVIVEYILLDLVVSGTLNTRIKLRVGYLSTSTWNNHSNIWDWCLLLFIIILTCLVLFIRYDRPILCREAEVSGSRTANMSGTRAALTGLSIRRIRATAKFPGATNKILKIYQTTLMGVRGRHFRGLGDQTASTTLQGTARFSYGPKPSSGLTGTFSNMNTSNAMPPVSTIKPPLSDASTNVSSFISTFDISWVYEAFTTQILSSWLNFILDWISDTSVLLYNLLSIFHSLDCSTSSESSETITIETNVLSRLWHRWPLPHDILVEFHNTSNILVLRFAISLLLTRISLFFMSVSKSLQTILVTKLESWPRIVTLINQMRMARESSKYLLILLAIPQYAMVIFTLYLQVINPIT